MPDCLAGEAMKRIVKQDLLAGFFHPADAIVPCKRCGAVEGVPCRPLSDTEKGTLKPGFVHLGEDDVIVETWL